MEFRMKDLKEIKYHGIEIGHLYKGEKLDVETIYNIIDSDLRLSYVMGYGWSLINEKQRVVIRLMDYQLPKIEREKAKKESKKQREFKEKCIKEINNMSLIELLNKVDLRNQLIKVALGELKLDDIVGKYYYKNIKVSEIKKTTFDSGVTSYTLIYNYFDEYDTPINYMLFNDDSRLEYKFNCLLDREFITESEYENYTNKKVIHDPDENKKGYFQCWECGIWQPNWKRQEDGTCGC